MAKPSATLDPTDLPGGTVSIKCPDHGLYERALGPDLVIQKGKILRNGDTVKLMWPRVEVRTRPTRTWNEELQRDVESVEEYEEPVAGFRQFDIIGNAQVTAGTRGVFVVNGESHLLRREVGLDAEHSQVKVLVGPAGCFE